MFGIYTKIKLMIYDYKCLVNFFFILNQYQVTILPIV